MGDQFTRRGVNRGLLAAAFACAAPRATPANASTLLFDFAIAGGWFHGLPGMRDRVAIGEPLALRAEPDNPHDANAVAVHRGNGFKLGYIPRVANEPVARLLERGARIEAVAVGRLAFAQAADIPDDFAFTGFTDGDPRIRLTLRA